MVETHERIKESSIDIVFPLDEIEFQKTTKKEKGKRDILRNVSLFDIRDILVLD